MIKLECTSCKKALEADEKTLSDREASVVRCPSCGVSLLVDKRKTSVVGPQVRVAPDEHKPIIARPSAEELATTDVTSVHIGLIEDLYRIAEDHLRAKEAVRTRTSALSVLATDSRNALTAMRIAVPAPTSDEVRRVTVSTPNESRFDEQLTKLNDYFQDSRAITEHSNRIWPDASAQHRYAPIVEWQAEARSAVRLAYTSLATRESDLKPQIARLENVLAKLARLQTQYQTEERRRQAAVATISERIAGLRVERESAEKQLADLQSAAQRGATTAVKGSGCGIAILAVIVALVAGGSTRSGEGAVIAFVLTLAAGLWLAWKIGFAGNHRERRNVEDALSGIGASIASGHRELAEAEESLGRHRAERTEIVSSTSWSLLTTPDADLEAVVPPAKIGTNGTRDRQPPSPDRLSSAPDVPTGSLAPTPTGSDQPITTGSTPPIHDTTAMPGIVPSAAGSDEIQPATMANPVFIPKRNHKRTIAVAAALTVIVGIAAGFAWRSAFGYRARINQALRAGQMFEPAGASVYDLYKRELARDSGSPVLAEIAPRIQAVLAPPTDDAFGRWYRDSDDTVNWGELERACEFLVVLDPENKLHRMRQFYAAAQQNIDARDYARAISNYEEALKLDSSWVLALNGIGKVYMIEGSPLFNEQLGVAYYERAAAADPQFTWAAKNLGDHAIRSRDYRRAERYLRQALASAPQRPSILRALALVCRKTGRGAEAIGYYEQSLAFEKDPLKIATTSKAIAAIRSGMS